MCVENDDSVLQETTEIQYSWIKRIGSFQPAFTFDISFGYEKWFSKLHVDGMVDRMQANERIRSLKNFKHSFKCSLFK